MRSFCAQDLHCAGYRSRRRIYICSSSNNTEQLFQESLLPLDEASLSTTMAGTRGHDTALSDAELQLYPRRWLTQLIPAWGRITRAMLIREASDLNPPLYIARMRRVFGTKNVLLNELGVASVADRNHDVSTVGRARSSGKWSNAQNASQA